MGYESHEDIDKTGQDPVSFGLRLVLPSQDLNTRQCVHEDLDLRNSSRWKKVAVMGVGETNAYKLISSVHCLTVALQSQPLWELVFSLVTDISTTFWVWLCSIMTTIKKIYEISEWILQCYFPE